MNIQEFQSLSLTVLSSQQLTAAYQLFKPVLMLPISGAATLALDLGKLPTKPFSFKNAFLLWAIQANASRINAGQEPVFPLQLIRACPLWRAMPAPIITIQLTKDGLLKQVGRNQKVIGSASGGALKRSKG